MVTLTNPPLYHQLLSSIELAGMLDYQPALDQGFQGSYANINGQTIAVVRTQSQVRAIPYHPTVNRKAEANK